MNEEFANPNEIRPARRPNRIQQNLPPQPRPRTCQPHSLEAWYCEAPESQNEPRLCQQLHIEVDLSEEEDANQAPLMPIEEMEQLVEQEPASVAKMQVLVLEEWDQHQVDEDEEEPLIEGQGELDVPEAVAEEVVQAQPIMHSRPHRQKRRFEPNESPRHRPLVKAPRNEIKSEDMEAEYAVIANTLSMDPSQLCLLCGNEIKDEMISVSGDHVHIWAEKITADFIARYVDVGATSLEVLHSRIKIGLTTNADKGFAFCREHFLVSDNISILSLNAEFFALPFHMFTTSDKHQSPRLHVTIPEIWKAIILEQLPARRNMNNSPRQHFNDIKFCLRHFVPTSFQWFNGGVKFVGTDDDFPLSNYFASPFLEPQYKEAVDELFAAVPNSEKGIMDTWHTKLLDNSKCNICNRVVSTSVNSLLHHMHERSGRLLCMICQKTFPCDINDLSDTLFLNHIGQFHKNIVYDFECIFGCERRYKCPTTFRQHLFSSHIDELSFHSDCGLSFAHADKYDSHISCHIRNNVSDCCITCGLANSSIIISQGNVLSHDVIHSIEMAASCNICSSIFEGASKVPILKWAKLTPGVQKDIYVQSNADLFRGYTQLL
ncbi:unnamed protein product [Caenorhabditis bovis]|uniref:C2H2-type domain-containing protein n=1 Tax=Caenorhabditis bovis TaxID=2654633 RepID=A0A8S1EGT1_9PELO|nr:unnamed protein product [Caenorhabditis bovis]